MKLKIDSNIVENYKTAFAAGVLIGFGVIINTTIINPIIGSLFFSFGLLVIIALKLPLYTGRIGFVNRKDYPGMLISNLIGVMSTIIVYVSAKPSFTSAITDTSQIKFSKTFMEMFLFAILCGMLIHFAIKAKEYPVTILAIAIFILIGAEHCIADFPFLIFNFTIVNFIKWVLVVIGNSLGAIFAEYITTENKNEICSDNSK